jgi:transposase
MSPPKLDFSPKEKNKHSTPRRRNRIVQCVKLGLSARNAAEECGVTVSHVRGTLRRWKHQNGGISKPGRGRPSALSDRDKRAIIREIEVNPFIQNSKLLEYAGLTCSETTLTRYVKLQGFKHTWAAQRPYLTAENAESRYRWALAHRHYDLAFWRTVVFSDECSVQRGQGQQRVWTFRPHGNYIPTTNSKAKRR